MGLAQHDAGMGTGDTNVDGGAGISPGENDTKGDMCASNTCEAIPSAHRSEGFSASSMAPNRRNGSRTILRRWGTKSVGVRIPPPVPRSCYEERITG